MASYRRIASDGDYGFNRNEANKRKQYARATTATTTALSSDDIHKINCLSSYFKNTIIKKWRDRGEYHVMVDSDWQKAIDLCKLVYDPVPMRMPSVMADAGSVLVANICAMASAIEEKCAIFLGMPENVSLVKKMLTVYTKTPESATLLYRSTLFNKAILSRKKEKVNITSDDVIKERFKNHVTKPFRPSLFERFGTTAFKEEIGASNGAFSTLSASNTHAKAIVHFTRVACGNMRNSLDFVSGLKEEERASVARSLLKESVSPLLDDDAAILYGNATDRRVFAQLVENEPMNHGIIPKEFTRDMERTPYVEIDHGSNTVTVYSDRFVTNEHGNVVKSHKPISLKVNIGQLLCDMIFGSDWDIHLKDYLSLLGYETFFDKEGSLKNLIKRLLLNKRRTDLGDLALIMVSRYIKKISNAEFDRLLISDDGDDDPIVPTTITNYIRLVVRHIYFDVFYFNGLQNICTRLSENYQTPIETVDGELEEVTGNLFLSKIVDSLHIMRNQDLTRVCYNIDVSVCKKEDDFDTNRVSMLVEDTPTFFDGKCDNITVSWDAASRRVIAVSKSIKLLLNDDDESASTRNASLLLEIQERLKRDVPPSRFFNYKAMYDAVKHVLKENDSPICNRFTNSSRMTSVESTGVLVAAEDIDSTDGRPIMREDVQETATSKDSSSLRSNKLAMFGIIDRKYVSDIYRWEKNVDAVRDDLPISQISKLDDIEQEIQETKLSKQAVIDRINDTELSKATDSILKRSLGGGSKFFVGRFVAIAITGPAIGILGKATADVLHASKGVHYNVHDVSNGDLKSFKITRFSCANDNGSHSNDTEASRWGHHWSDIPWVKPSLTCDRGLTVAQAASEVLVTAASKITGKTIEARAATSTAEVASGVFDLMINSSTFISGVPVVAGLASTRLSFANWKRGLGVALSLFVLILFVRFFAGSGFLTLKWFGVDTEEKRRSTAFMSRYTSADEERIRRLFISSKEGADQIPRNFEIIRPLFGPARPTQEMTYFYVGLLY